MPFGDNINAGLLRPDYSAILEGGRAEGAGYAALGQGIAKGLNAASDYFKQQGEKKKTIKQAELYGKAAMTLFPEIAPSIEESLNMIRDENVPINDRYAAAEAIQGSLNMGMQRMKYDADSMNALREAQIAQAKVAADMYAESRKPPAMATFNENGGEQQRVWNSQTQTYDFPDQFLGGMDPQYGGAPPNQQGTQMADAAALDYAAGLTGGQTDVPMDAMPIPQDITDDQRAALIEANTPPQDGMVLPPKPQSAPRAGFKPAEPKSSPFQGGEMQVDEMGREYQSDINNPQIRKYSNGQIWEVTTSPDGSVKMTQRTGGGRAGQAAANAEAMQKKNARIAIPLVKDALAAVREMPKGASGIGAAVRVAGSQIPGLGGAPRRATLALEPIKNMIALDNLTALRQASPTGGALGNVSNAEGQRLEQKWGLLNAEQDPQITERNLVELTKDYLDTVYGSDSQIDKLVTEKKVSLEQARQAKAEKYQTLAEIMGGQQASPAQSVLPQTQFAPKVSVGEAGKSLLEQFGR